MMRRLADLSVAVVASACVAAGVISAACGSPSADVERKPVEFGVHRLTVIVPEGWTMLDQGAQKRFRKGEADVVLQNLGRATTRGNSGETAPAPIGNLDKLADWGLAALDHDQRRDVKSRRQLSIDGRDATEIETWNRLDHTSPRSHLFVAVGDDLLALHTPRHTTPDTLEAYAAIRDSLQFTTSERR
jgi:hypothetical protein